MPTYVHTAVDQFCLLGCTYKSLSPADVLSNCSSKVTAKPQLISDIIHFPCHRYMKEYIYFQITAHLTNEQVDAVDVIIFEHVYKIW